MIDQTEVDHVIHGIKMYGGSFMKALGEALRLADIHNQQKIKSTWPAEWEQYLQMGRRLAEMEKDEERLNEKSKKETKQL